MFLSELHQIFVFFSGRKENYYQLVLLSQMNCCIFIFWYFFILFNRNTQEKRILYSLFRLQEINFYCTKSSINSEK